MKRKILIVVNSLSGGGLEQVLLDFVSIVIERFEVKVLSLYQTESRYSRNVKDYCPLDILDKFRLFDKIPFVRSLYRRLYDRNMVQQFLYNRYVNNYNPNIEIAFAEGWSTRLVAYSANKLAKKFAWIHTDSLNEFDPQKNKNTLIFKKTLPLFNETIFVSKTLEYKYRELLQLTQTKTINNCIDIDGIRKLANNFYVARSNRFRMICIGRLSWEKGFDRVIKSISKLPPEIKSNCELMIVGDGIERTRLKDLVSELGLEDNILFIGMQNNPYPYLKSSDVLLSPSRYEGFGLVLIEAMALNVPTIACSTVGANEVLDYGRYGMIIPNTDDAYNKILLDLIKERKMTEKYKPLLQERTKYYSKEHFKKKVLNLL